MRRLLPLCLVALVLAPCLHAAATTPVKRPNILLAVADDWSFGHATALGATWVRTPNFDRVAAEGVMFTRAYTPNAKCSPSRSAILTGRNPWQLQAAGNHWPTFPSEFKSFPEALAEGGYSVGYTGKGWSPGKAFHADGSPRDLLVQHFNERTTPPPATGIAGTDYAANFDDFLAAAPAGNPWFFWYGGHEPHRVYEFQSGTAKGGKQLADINRVPAYWPDNATVREDMLDYAFEVEHFDRHLGHMLAQLAARGELENTLIIVTSDNGMPFPRAKGQTYEISNHLPLAIRWPAGVAQPGRAVDDYVSFIDLAPTILSAAGLSWGQTGLSPSPGRPLQPLLAATRSGLIDPARDHVLVGRERNDLGRPGDVGYPTRGIVRDGWLYLHNFAPDRWPACDPVTGYLDVDSSPTKTVILRARRDHGSDVSWTLSFGRRGADELYDLTADPDCIRNLANSPVQAARVATLRQQLMAELAAQEDPRVLGHGDMFDQFPPTQPGMTHFYERWTAGEATAPRYAAPTDFEPGPLD